MTVKPTDVTLEWAIESPLKHGEMKARLDAAFPEPWVWGDSSYFGGYLGGRLTREAVVETSVDVPLVAGFRDLENPMREQDKWKCPWCGRLATIVRESICCDSRQCECGAVAIGAPSADWDEVTDEAINLFEVEIRPESCGSDSLLREDVRRAGVEMRPGPRDPDMGHPCGWAYLYTWFRREPDPGA